MKYLLFIAFLVFPLFQSCTKEEDSIATCDNCDFTCLDVNVDSVMTNDCIDNWECDFSVTPNSEVDLEDVYGIKVGDKNVFQMINSTQGSLMIADDEFTNILIFELKESQNSFSVEDAELTKMNVHYRVACYCTETEFKDVTSGCLQGEKQSDGTWFIQGDLIVPYTYGDTEVKFDAMFSN